MSRIGNLVIFTLGAAIGSVITFKLVDKGYQQIANDQINQMKRYYKEKYESSEDEEEFIDDDIESEETEALKAKSSKPEPKNSISDFAKIVMEKNGYVDYSGHNENDIVEKGESTIREDIEIITPDEFEDSTYDDQYLTLYADGVIDNDFTGDILTESDIIEYLGGRENVDQMGKYEVDLIHIRNHRLEIDYEISRNLDKYRDGESN